MKNFLFFVIILMIFVSCKDNPISNEDGKHQLLGKVVDLNGAVISGANVNSEFVISCGKQEIPIAKLLNEITSFCAVPSPNKVQLNWETDSTKNLYGFEIELKDSSANSEFKKIGFVEGLGKSTEKHSYHFTLTNGSMGTTLIFRLKAIDIDGKFNYTPKLIINTDIVNRYETKTDLYGLFRSEYPKIDHSYSFSSFTCKIDISNTGYFDFSETFNLDLSINSEKTFKLIRK